MANNKTNAQKPARRLPSQFTSGATAVGAGIGGAALGALINLAIVRLCGHPAATGLITMLVGGGGALATRGGLRAFLIGLGGTGAVQLTAVGWNQLEEEVIKAVAKRALPGQPQAGNGNTPSAPPPAASGQRPRNAALPSEDELIELARALQERERARARNAGFSRPMTGLPRRESPRFDNTRRANLDEQALSDGELLRNAGFDDGPLSDGELPRNAGFDDGPLSDGELLRNAGFDDGPLSDGELLRNAGFGDEPLSDDIV